MMSSQFLTQQIISLRNYKIMDPKSHTTTLKRIPNQNKINGQVSHFSDSKRHRCKHGMSVGNEPISAKYLLGPGHARVSLILQSEHLHSALREVQILSTNWDSDNNKIPFICHLWRAKRIKNRLD